MSLRALKTTAIQLGMVVVTTKVYKAADDRGGLSGHNIHKDCGELVKQPKVCPTHGELRPEQIVKGYEVGPGEYALVTDAEIDAIADPPGQPLQITKFVPAGSVPFGQSTYYLSPDKFSTRAYALMRDTMAKLGVEGITQITFRGRPHLATVRAAGDLIVLNTHNWPSEVRDPAGLVPDTQAPSEAEIKMATALVKGMAGTFDEAEHVDTYQQMLEAIIADKIAGRPVTAPEAAPQAPVPDLMAALTASLAAQEEKPKGRKKAAA